MRDVLEDVNEANTPLASDSSYHAESPGNPGFKYSLQGRTDPKISSPLSEISFSNYTYECLYTPNEYISSTASWNNIACIVLSKRCTNTCHLVKRNRTPHPRNRHHELVISLPDPRQPKSGSLVAELSPRTPEMPLRDKRWLSRSALMSLNNPDFTRSLRSHKSSDFVSQVKSDRSPWKTFADDVLAVDRQVVAALSKSTCLGVEDTPGQDVARPESTREPGRMSYQKLSRVSFGNGSRDLVSKTGRRILAGRSGAGAGGRERREMLRFRGAGMGAKGCHRVSGAPEGAGVRGRFALVQPPIFTKFSDGACGHAA